MNVPSSRLEPENMYSLGRTNEITREEVKFGKFIRRIRARFSTLFVDALGRHLQLKNIVNAEEWAKLKPQIHIVYNRANYFEELKDLEIKKERVNSAGDFDNFVGKYFSKTWVRKNILRQTEEEIEEIDAEIEDEKEDEPGDDPDLSGVDGQGSPSKSFEEKPRFLTGVDDDDE